MVIIILHAAYTRTALYLVFFIEPEPYLGRAPRQEMAAAIAGS
jgi:hypothetical protein